MTETATRRTIAFKAVEITLMRERGATDDAKAEAFGELSTLMAQLPLGELGEYVRCQVPIVSESEEVAIENAKVTMWHARRNASDRAWGVVASVLGYGGWDVPPGLQSAGECDSAEADLVKKKAEKAAGIMDGPADSVSYAQGELEMLAARLAPAEAGRFARGEAMPPGMPGVWAARAVVRVAAGIVRGRGLLP